jgi:hypothetical protein
VPARNRTPPISPTSAPNGALNPPRVKVPKSAPIRARAC